MKINSVHLAFIVISTLSLPAYSCINEIGTNNRGEQVRPILYAGKRLKPELVTPTSKAPLIPWAKDVVDEARRSPSFKSLNNLAVVLIRFERLPEAAKLLQFIERQYPGHYETASNLGTTYELMGRNDDALKWILKGLRRNAKAHWGTEWLHVHILKAKLGRIPQPAAGLSILDLDFGSEPMPVLPAHLPVGNDGKRLNLFDLDWSLRYQLLERIRFVAAPDPLVAGLLLDWANLEMIGGAVESADVLYDAALQYGSKEVQSIAMRKRQVATILALAKSRQSKIQGRCEICEAPSLYME